VTRRGCRGTTAYEVLGWADDGARLDLDHRRFAYAGKFVVPRGIAVARDDRGDESEGRWGNAAGVVAAVAFDRDRTDERIARLRYLTVRHDRRGEGLGPRLTAFATAGLHERGASDVRIAVNNPVAFHALHKAGFGWIGDRTGVAELVLVHPSPDDRGAAYRDGLAVYADRDLPTDQRALVEARRDAEPPARIVTPPTRS
jgi:ribosomal protein S18 acetylase RimI-like enzyme